MPARRNASHRKAEAASTAAARILQAALREDCTAQELSDMACGDPAFAGRVLAWVNSPAYSLARTVVDVRQATSLLGIRGLRNIALGMVLTDHVPAGPKAACLLGNGLRRALVAHSVAEQVSREHADAAFTVGLFLEAGLLTMAAESIDQAHEIASGPAAHRIVRERALGRKPHPELGAEIAQSYRFTEEMVHAIAHHHDPEPPEAPLSRVAWAAERIAAVYEGGFATEIRAQAESAAEAVGLDADVVTDLLEMIPAMVQAGAEIFERDIGEQLSWRELLNGANQQLMRLNAQYVQTVRALEANIEEKERLAEELRVANEKLQQIATHDALTGLPNRRLMDEMLHKFLAQARRGHKPLAMVILDLDHFKRINDDFGHDVGDVVLRTVAEVVLGSVRDSDLASRFGGEELVLVLPETGLEQASMVAERVREAIESTAIVAGGATVKVTASFGVAALEQPTDACVKSSGKALFKASDEALYEAKRAGRNRVVVARV